MTDWLRRLRAISTTSAWLLIGLGGAVLVGWTIGSEQLKSVVPGYVSMKANTAVGFVLAGVGVLARRYWRSEWLARALASVLAALGALTLLQDITGGELGIDEFLFDDEHGATQTGAPGRMSPLTSTGFFVLGFAILGQRIAPASAQVLVVLSGLIGYFALTCYALGLVPVTRFESFTAIAAHTAFGFVVAVPALLLVEPERGFASVFLGPGVAGRLARWLLPAAAAIPLASGVLVGAGARLGWFSAAFGEAAVILTSCILYTLLSWSFVHAMGAFHEERSDLQLSLGRTGAALDKKRRELEQFAFTISHDLKSPLVSIRGFLGLMKQDLEEGRTEEALENAQDVDDAAVHMSLLIDDLLTYSRIGRGETETEEIDMQALLEDIAEMHRPTSEELDAKVSVAPGVPPCVGFPNSIRRAIENLFLNALRYGHAEGEAPRVSMGGFVHGDELQYYVRDEGPGIEPEYHERIFGLFQRLASDHADGTGLGLASVAKVADQHGGRAWVESEPGRGSTFWISIRPKEISI